MHIDIFSCPRKGDTIGLYLTVARQGTGQPKMQRTALSPAHLSVPMDTRVRASSVVSNSLQHYGLKLIEAPLSMGSFRQEYWSGLPFSSPGNLPNPRIEPESPALPADALPSEPPGKPLFIVVCRFIPLSLSLLGNHSLFSISVTLFLFWKQTHLYHSFRFSI